MKKAISIDIQKHLSANLDISNIFPKSELHAISSSFFKKKIDEFQLIRPEINLQKNQKLEIDNFETFGMLDLMYSDLSENPQKINLVPHLDIPRDAIDIRLENPIKSDLKYSDLFTRKLPSRLIIKKFFKSCKFFWRRNKNFIIYGFSMFFAIFVPWILAIKISLESGIDSLKDLKNSTNITQIKQKIHNSRTDFERANFLFFPFSWLPIDIIDTANRGISGAKEIITALDNVVSRLPDSTTFFSPKIIDNSESEAHRGNSKDIFLLENIWLDLPTNWLTENKEYIISAFENIKNVGKIFSQARWNSKYDNYLKTAGSIINKFSPVFDISRENFGILTEMLGHKSPQRYMIFNQNRDEIRTNGGFPGSIISFTVYKGNILDYRTDDVYYYDWNLYPHKETPPPGIALLTDNYGLRDVNYYPDFRDTLEKANNFVEKSWDSTITTAVAIHQGLIEEILAIVWEIQIDWINDSFNDQNFSLLMSILVENKFAKEKTPKDILFKFIDDFGKKIISSSPDKIEKIADKIVSYWQDWQILIASRNENINNFLQTIQKPLPWKTYSKNWIYPAFTSVSGNKSDRYMTRKISTNISKIENCNYKVDIDLIFKNNFSEKNLSEINNFMDKYGIFDLKEREKMAFIQWNGKNINFVRYFVPKNAILTSSGAEVHEDKNSKIFAFMMETLPWASTSKTLSYNLEIPNCSDYNNEILIYEQPWLRDYLIWK